LIAAWLGYCVVARRRRDERSLNYHPDRDSHRLLNSHGGRRSGFGCFTTALDRLLNGRHRCSVADFQGIFACTGCRLCARDLVTGQRRLLAHGQ